MTALYAEIGGTTIPLADCDWVLWEPCGCLQAISVAASRTTDRVVATEEDAWKAFYDYAAERKKAAKAGMRVELITHERWRSELMEPFGKPCPHGGES